MDSRLGCNPWVSIWNRPRQTIRAIVSFNPNYRLSLLMWIYGLPVALNAAQSLSLSSFFPTAIILLGALVLSGLIGVVSISLMSGLLYWTGKWIGGQGSFQTIRAAIAWSSALNIPTILAWGVLLAFFGGQVFLNVFPEMSFIGYELVVVFAVVLTQTVVSIWSLIVLLHVLGEVQGFSAWKALMNLLIPLLMVVAAAWFIMFTINFNM